MYRGLHHPLLLTALAPYPYYRCPVYDHQEYLIPENYGKPRNRFSEYEDAVICEGVARGLTWGQISAQLPNRKRATCFNRYRTLQGIRKSRRSYRHPHSMLTGSSYPITPGYSRRASTVSSCSSFGSTPSPPTMPSNWLPNTPPLFKDTVTQASSAVIQTVPAGYFLTDLQHQPSQWIGPTLGSRYHFGYH
ncbi:hypothetical protein BX666DRAFT_1997836 [Dichotomocladium elegans]|nr:hypothetical protein BX666DRAFT_1997836 [Dichotomocladium elegans]